MVTLVPGRSPEKQLLLQDQEQIVIGCRTQWYLKIGGCNR